MASIDARSLGPVSVAARAFRRRDRTFVTTIVKASCTLAQDAAMAIAKPTPIVASDQLRSSSPVASARRASELAPFVSHPEIVLDAIAFAAGPPIARLTTRLAVARGTEMLLSKHLEIVGDRRIPADGPGPNPAPFQHMPIEYERAFGGLGRAENPAGMGQAESDGSARVPNVRAGDGATASPPGYGPIPARWPLRRAKRGSQHGDGYDPSIVDLADDLEDDYFQTAPADQRVDAWRAGDLVVLANLHPTFVTLRVTLPSMTGVALVVHPDGRREGLDLTLDTVFIEPHAMRADLLFRGHVAVADPTGVRVLGAIRGTEAFEWPRDLDEAGARAPAPVVAPAPRYAAEGTLVMEPKGAPSTRNDTLVLEDAAHDRASATPAIPTTFDATRTLDAPLGTLRPSTPFGRTKRDASKPPPLATGTPWTHEVKRTAPPVESPMSTTMVVAAPKPAEDEPAPEARRAGSTFHGSEGAVSPPTPPITEPPPAATAAPSPPPPPPVPAPSAPSLEEPLRRKKAVWRDDPASAPAPVAAPVAPPPRPDQRDKLYKKFK